MFIEPEAPAQFIEFFLIHGSSFPLFMSQGRFYHARAAAARGETAHCAAKMRKMQEKMQNGRERQNVRDEWTI